MAIAPNDWEQLAVEILRLYEDAETRILRKIAERTTAGLDAPDYQLRKLAQLNQVKEQIRKVLHQVEKTAVDLIEEMIERVYYAGAMSAEDDLLQAGKVTETARATIPGTNITIATQETITGILTTIDKRTITAILGELTGKLRASHLQILRRTDDIYRQVVGRVAAESMAGVGTRLNAAQRALKQFTSAGIGAFIDARGYSWDMATYAEMSTRSAIGQSSIEGHINRMQAYGEDLAQVSDHPEECERCRPWEMKVLSVSGDTPGYPTLAEARVAGLFHPRCGHRLHVYIEGFSPQHGGKPDPEGYRERQKQRYIERTIRQWKRREAVAVTEEEAKRAAAKVRQWQATMRKFIDDTDRRRKYERESITRAR